MTAVLHVAAVTGKWVLVGFVFLGAVPLVAATCQFLPIAVHGWRHHYDRCAPYFPRTAILIPAWNEGAVIGQSIDRLLDLDYPRDALRIYVVDDASTDDTPEVVCVRQEQHPGTVFHLRRKHGGQGKAHTLNHGLDVVLSDDWMEAVLIMDADVIHMPDSLRRMTRHLADPDVGAVTAYIKEGSQPGNYLTRAIGYEYITAQAAARRSQNVLGAMACLAGGAQLLSRSNLEDIGGHIDTSSLAEDTFTTFRTQLSGRQVVFEPHAIVLAEEPGSINALWRQRLRWARGNIQVTMQHRWLWFRRSSAHGLGDLSFGVFWFCILLQPIFMILTSVGLVVLFFIEFAIAWACFQALWIINAITYVFITGFALLIDPSTGRRTWKEAAMFPGAVSLVIILYTCFPPLFTSGLAGLLELAALSPPPICTKLLILAAYLWLAASMPAAWLAKAVETRKGIRWLSPLLIYVVGYGSLLCTVTFTAYVKELRGAEMKWDKTEKTGMVTATTSSPPR